MWDAKTGQLLHTFEHVGWVSSIAFSGDGFCLLIDVGTLLLPHKALPDEALSAPALSPQAPAKAISIAERWITVDAEDTLWIPADYCQGRTAVHSCCVVFGYSTGRVLLLEIQ